MDCMGQHDMRLDREADGRNRRAAPLIVEDTSQSSRFVERKLSKEKCRWLSSHEAFLVGAAPQM